LSHEPFLFGAAALLLFHPDLGFDLRANAGLKFRAIAQCSRGAFTLLLFGPEPRLFLRLTLGFFFGPETSSFLSATSIFFFCSALSFFFRQATGAFGSKLLRLFFRPASRFLLRVEAGFLLGSPFFSRLGPQFGFNIRPQARFLFGAHPGLLFSFPARLLIDPPPLSLIDQTLGLMGGAQSRLLTGVNPLDFFFDRAESHFGPSSQFILLRAFSGFRLQVAALLFRATAYLFFFGLPQLRQLGIMRRFARAKLLINLPATQLFD
jgi:hypothetical protein